MPDRVVVGRVVKPHGIRGEVVVVALSDVPGRLDAGTVVSGRGRDWTVETSRWHQGRLLIRFAGIADRNAAELLRGLELEAEAVDLSDSETYYAHELVGMAVVGDDGSPLGTVRDLIDLPTSAGYDLLEVERPDGTTWLLPAVDDYVEVRAEDDREHLVLVDPPEGLLALGDQGAAEEIVEEGS